MGINCYLPFVALLLIGCDNSDRGGEYNANDLGYSSAASVTSMVSPDKGLAPGRSPQVSRTDPDTQKPLYVGSKLCANCHPVQHVFWQNSHHDLAMQEADENSVLGDFENAEFTYFGTVSRFYKRGGRFFVRTDGPEGTLQNYPIAYTFGVSPLQQYLIEFPGGRLQVLGIAWDAREKSKGGQRWFHLHPEENIEHGDELHWTGINQNWNFMCADCHSTNLQKNYDLVSDSYATTWSDIDVGCEACHGPGSRHLNWAQKPTSDIPSKGFAVTYDEREKSAWAMDRDTGIARLESTGKAQREIETCAACHSRRSTSFPNARPGDSLLDHYNLALLGEPLYHADGQIKDEVFVYGSFLQSKMHAAGVTCSDCHDPHSLQLRARGNDVCAQCHLPARFDSEEHHFHAANSEGAQCVNCHLPARTYMQVDIRRDHSFRVPRPDLAAMLGTPDVCTGCHTNKSRAWAASRLERKFGKPDNRHFGEAIYAGRNGLPDAEAKLVRLLADESQPIIARATAIRLLPRYLSRPSAQLLQAIAQGDNKLLNLGLAQSLEAVPPSVRPVFAIPLLYDKSRVVAALAANSLADAPIDSYPHNIQQQFDKVLNDYLNSERFNADRPESLANLAALHQQRGEISKAEGLFKLALARAPYYTPAYVNLADLYRATEREQAAEALLRDGIQNVSTLAPIHHSLGLSLVRQRRNDEAIQYLRMAAENLDTSSRYVYVYAIALNSSGHRDSALAVLEQGLERFPNDAGILRGLVALYREAGNEGKAQYYEARL